MAVLATSAIMSPANVLLGENVAKTVSKELDQQKMHNEDIDKKQIDVKEVNTKESNSQEARERQLLSTKHGNVESSASKGINDNPADKELGTSSKVLRVDDFDLLKTLGTGTIQITYI